jgi:hypothetical protein
MIIMHLDFTNVFMANVTDSMLSALKVAELWPMILVVKPGSTNNGAILPCRALECSIAIGCARATLFGSTADNKGSTTTPALAFTEGASWALNEFRIRKRTVTDVFTGI